MDDLISRQQAIDAICEHGTDLERRGITILAVANHKQATVDLLENLPSAQPERKMGRWLPDNTDYYRTKFICSVCGESEEVPTMGFGYAPMWGYCPNCGAMMKGADDGTR